MSSIYFWHGWGLGSPVWDDLIKILQMKKPTYQWVSDSLAGYDNPSKSPTLLDDLLDVTTIPNSCILCAWSMGALLALLAAYRYPQKIKKLILIGATPCFLNKNNWTNGLDSQVLTKLRQDIKENKTKAMRRFIAHFNQNDQNVKKITKSLNHLTSPSAEILDAGLNILENANLCDIIPNISQKILLLHGENDPLMPLSAAKWLENNLSCATLSVFRNVAHAPFLSEPENCALQILKFLDEQ